MMQASFGYSLSKNGVILSALESRKNTKINTIFWKRGIYENRTY